MELTMRRTNIALSVVMLFALVGSARAQAPASFRILFGVAA
jgi:hypothetical protein